MTVTATNFHDLLRSHPKTGDFPTLLHGVEARGIELGTFEMVESAPGTAKVGLDLIAMDDGDQFDAHVHPGHHVLVVLSGRGFIGFGSGEQLEMRTLMPGSIVFVEAHEQHAVFCNEQLRFLAFGVPHRPLAAADRMALVAAD